MILDEWIYIEHLQTNLSFEISLHRALVLYLQRAIFPTSGYLLASEYKYNNKKTTCISVLFFNFTADPMMHKIYTWRQCYANTWLDENLNIIQGDKN